jgi:ADP-ribosyl-[dinitrogen reductase] hydrolase
LTTGPPRPATAHAAAIRIVSAFYRQPPFATELPHFEKVLSLRLASLAERDISSTGYVVDTLTAAIWCLLTSKNYRETVLKAVNLGGDTDTTGIVAGSLAGIHGGLVSVPMGWRTAMAREEDLTTLFEQFAASCS